MEMCEALSRKITSLIKDMKWEIKSTHNLDVLAALDEKLCELCDANQNDVSITLFKKTVKAKGICLRNMHAYGSMGALKRALRLDEKNRISLKSAEGFKYVKMCLLNLRC